MQRMNKVDQTEENTEKVNRNKVDQIDCYWTKEKTEENTKKVNRILKKDGKNNQELSNIFYAGIEDYWDARRAKAAQNNPSNEPIDTNFFRKKFLDYITSNEELFPSYNGNAKLRQTKPEEAAITMDELLGKKGTKLYKLALEEEMNSYAYMDAVLIESANEYEGQWKDQKRPYILVGGPSGCGKSHGSATLENELVEIYLEKSSESQQDVAGDKGKSKVIDGDSPKSYIIKVDGGVARQVSQIRKEVIKLAIKQGYTGVKDLHKQSKALEKTKSRIKEFLLHETCPHGVNNPDTFSTFPIMGRSMLDEIATRSDTIPIFSRVVGKDPKTFRKVVAEMGSSRAWKKDWSEDNNPNYDDLNDGRFLPESKAYGPNGFDFGLAGSILAGEYLRKKLGKQYKEYIIINDLVMTDEDGLVSAAVLQEFEEYWKNAEIKLINYKKMNGNKVAPDIISKNTLPLWKADKAIFSQIQIIKKGKAGQRNELDTLIGIRRLLNETNSENQQEMKEVKLFILVKSQDSNISKATRNSLKKALNEMTTLSEKIDIFEYKCNDMMNKMLGKYAKSVGKFFHKTGNIATHTNEGMFFGGIFGGVGLIVGTVVGFAVGLIKSMIEPKKPEVAHNARRLNSSSNVLMYQSGLGTPVKGSEEKEQTTMNSSQLEEEGENEREENQTVCSVSPSTMDQNDGTSRQNLPPVFNNTP